MDSLVAFEQSLAYICEVPPAFTIFHSGPIIPVQEFDINRRIELLVDIYRRVSYIFAIYKKFCSYEIGKLVAVRRRGVRYNLMI